MVTYALAWFVMLLWVFPIGLGIYGMRTGRWPGRQRQTIKFGDHEVSITDLGVALVLIGVIGASINAIAIPNDVPHLAPSRIDAPTVPTPPRTAQGPWKGDGNDVVLTVSTVTYIDHHARIELRIDNNSHHRSITGRDYYLTVVDNTARSRHIDFDSSSFYKNLTLGAGLVASGAVQVDTQWDRATQYFDVRVNVAGDGQYWTVTTPGIPVPEQERTGA